jgi:3-oxoacyl-[acyl-carrier protein] reductase
MMRLWNANLLGALAINSILIPKMTESKGGRLIFVGSMAGTQAIGSVGYNTVKAALNAYVRTLGNALIADSILVCGVNPGDFLATDNAMSRLQISNPDFFKNNVQKRNPRGHLATSVEVIKVITYLAFQADSLFAGSMIAIDGGGSLAY